MIKTLRRALTQLALLSCALLVLAAVGQPPPTPTLSQAPAVVTVALQRVPLTVERLRGTAFELPVQADCDASDVSAKAVSDAAAQALARSALRMRWLLTSPHASGRGCAAPGCTG